MVWFPVPGLHILLCVFAPSLHYGYVEIVPCCIFWSSVPCMCVVPCLFVASWLAWLCDCGMCFRCWHSHLLCNVCVRACVCVQVIFVEKCTRQDKRPDWSNAKQNQQADLIPGYKYFVRSPQSHHQHRCTALTTQNSTVRSIAVWTKSGGCFID